MIDEMPKGRKKVETRKFFPKKRKQMFDFLEKEVKKGRQGYVVYPLIEESEVLRS